MIANPQTLGFGANINRGVAATSRRYVIASNSDIEVTAGAVAELAGFAASIRVAASPRRSSGTRTAAGSPRGGASRPSAARSSGARRSAACSTPSSASAATTCSTSSPTEPTQSDWFLGAFLLLRREMLEELGGLDEGYRLYGDDIDLAYRPRGPAGNAGTSRTRS